MSTRRIIIVALAAIILLTLFAGLAVAANQGSDPFGNVAPDTEIRGANLLVNRHPIGNYELDVNVDTGITNPSGWMGAVPHMLAQFIWGITRWLAMLAIQIFSWAFSLDLITGAGVPGGGGTLDSISDAIVDLYNILRPLLIAAIALGGIWALWNGIVRRRYTGTLAGVALSVVLIAAALVIVQQPGRVIGGANDITNNLSQTVLGVAGGNVEEPEDAIGPVADQIFKLTVYNPFAVLNTGGIKSCTNADGTPNTQGSVCWDHTKPDGPGGAHGGYVDRFLAFKPGSSEREGEYKVLNNGGGGRLQMGTLEDVATQRGVSVNELPAAIRQSFRGSYRPDATDRAAVDIQQEGQGTTRLAMAVVIFLGDLPVILVVAALSLAVVFAQLTLLVMLAMAPVALLAAAVPGRGHDLFFAWISQVLYWLGYKVIAALVLAVILAAANALAVATGSAPWLLGYLLVTAFFALMFFRRNDIMRWLARPFTPRGNFDGAGVDLTRRASTRIQKQTTVVVQRGARGLRPRFGGGAPGFLGTGGNGRGGFMAGLRNAASFIGGAAPGADGDGGAAGRGYGAYAGSGGGGGRRRPPGRGPNRRGPYGGAGAPGTLPDGPARRLVGAPPPGAERGLAEDGERALPGGRNGVGEDGRRPEPGNGSAVFGPMGLERALPGGDPENGTTGHQTGGRSEGTGTLRPEDAGATRPYGTGASRPASPGAERPAGGAAPLRGTGGAPRDDGVRYVGRPASPARRPRSPAPLPPPPQPGSRGPHLLGRLRRRFR